MRKYKQFDNILNECLERLLIHGESVEQCLEGFPQHADELRPLLETAMATSQASVIQPRPEFKERARHQFHLVLREEKHKRSHGMLSWGWQPRWGVVVAVMLVLVLAGGGTVAAAGGSMPDEPLYRVKLATEQVRLALTPSAVGKAELYVKLADERVTEIISMANENKPEQIELTAQRLDAHLEEMVALSSSEGRREVTVETSIPAPPETPMLEASPAAEEPLSDEAQSVTKILPPQVMRAEAGEKSASEGRKTKLKETVETNAVENLDRLRALLEMVPEEARTALLQAIAVSEAGYEEVLEILDSP